MRSFFEHLIAIDSSTFVLMLAVCGCAVAILKAFVDRPLFVVVTGLTFIPCALLCRALMLDLGMTPTYDMALNSMVACGAGMILGFSLSFIGFVLAHGQDS